MSTTVYVKGIASSTSEKEVRDFFSFCGKITSLDVKPESEGADSSKTATVTFEKETAAKTALLLDNTQLGSSQVHVTAGGEIGDAAPTHTDAGHDDELSQEDKPRSRIFAEYLAHGYTISDSAMEKAIALDNKHGISNRFTSALKTFDDKYRASDKAKSLDASYGITDKANKGWLGLNSYFEKAVSTPTGQKLHSFYLQGDKQVRDIHTEARRLADLKGGKSSNTPETVSGTDKTVCACGSESGNCPCPPGKCGCANCGKSDPSAVAEVKEAAGEYAADPTPKA